MRPALAILMAVQQLIGPVRMVGPSLVPKVAAAPTIALKHQITVDTGTINATKNVGIVDLGSTVNASGDLLIVALATGSSANVGTDTYTACDSITNVNCIPGATSASTYTVMTPKCTTGTFVCVVIAYTCNAAPSVRYFGFGWNVTNAQDSNVTVFDVSHSVTSSCQDQAASFSGTALSTITLSTTFTTGTANEFGFSLLSDDNNCGPSFTGSAGTLGSGTTTLGTLAASCTSMLGAPEYQIYSAIQTSVSGTIVAGNSVGNPITFSFASFK